MSATLAGLQSQILGLMEEMDNELQALRCITGLLNGQRDGADGINLHELSYLLDPIIEREKAIVDEVRGMFRTVGFAGK